MHLSKHPNLRVMLTDFATEFANEKSVRDRIIDRAIFELLEEPDILTGSDLEMSLYLMVKRIAKDEGLIGEAPLSRVG